MEYCATAQVHSFQPRKKLVLRIALEDSDGKKLAGLPYELDGGDRPATRRLKIRTEPLAITVRVPIPDLNS